MNLQLKVDKYGDDIREYTVITSNKIFNLFDFGFFAPAFFNILYQLKSNSTIVMERALFIFIFLFRIFSKFFIVKQESIMVIQDLGVQLKTVYIVFDREQVIFYR